MENKLKLCQFHPQHQADELHSQNLNLGRYISEKYFKMICGIQGEINFSQRGWKEVIEDGSNNTYHRAMNYIEVPLLAHLAFGKDKGNGARFIINLES